MDFGIDQQITVPDPAGGTRDLLFNQDISFPSGIGRFRLQNISGADGATIRNPTTNRPHKSGAIIHAFKRGASVYTLEGIFEPENVATRWAMRDMLLGYLDGIVEADGTHVYTPPDGGLDRYHTVRLYDPNEQAIGADGLSGPKTFSITLIAGDWRAYSSGGTTEIPNGSTVTIPNDGNTEAWLNFVISPNGADVNAFSVQRTSDGVMVAWDGTGLPTFGHGSPLWDGGPDGDLNMLDETFYQGSVHNLLGGITLDESDFFSIPAGGADVLFASDDGLATCTVETRSAWVG